MHRKQVCPSSLRSSLLHRNSNGSTRSGPILQMSANGPTLRSPNSLSSYLPNFGANAREGTAPSAATAPVYRAKAQSVHSAATDPIYRRKAQSVVSQESSVASDYRNRAHSTQSHIIGSRANMMTPSSKDRKRNFAVYLSNVPENANMNNIYGAIRAKIGKFKSVDCSFLSEGV